ncbi:response regulator transcription factor [Streptomyces sp. YJ-C3]
MGSSGRAGAGGRWRRRPSQPQAEDRSGLTAREREVLRLTGRGLGPRAMAERLVVSPHTARGHVKRIMAKLDAHSQLETVVLAARSGLLRMPPGESTESPESTQFPEP